MKNLIEQASWHDDQVPPVNLTTAGRPVSSLSREVSWPSIQTFADGTIEHRLYRCKVILAKEQVSVDDDRLGRLAAPSARNGWPGDDHGLGFFADRGFRALVA